MVIDDYEDASSLTSEESHEPYFNTRTGAIVTAREAWAILAQHDERYRAKLEGRKEEEYGIAPAPSNDDVASLGPTQSSIDRALHPDYSPHKEAPRDDEDEETDPDILRAQAMALAAANGQKLTPEQIMLIARPDVQQQKLIEETRKAKKQHSVGISQIGADIKKFIEAEKDKSASQWGSDLGKFIEEQSMKLQGTAVINNAVAEGQTKKKMEGFGSEPIPDETELDEKDKEDVRISAVLWKRRSGLGKHSTIKAWEKRRVQLRGSKIMYYETPEEAEEKDANKVEPDSSTPATPKRQTLFEQAAQNAEQRIQIARDELSRMAQTVGLESLKPTPSDVPRGTIDIVKEKAVIGASIGHSGAPTPFCISIKVKSETKWKFCFESHGMLMEWLTAFNDVVVRSSVDSANEADGQNWAMQEYNINLTGNDAINNRQTDPGSDNVITRTFSRQLTSSESSRPIAIDVECLILSGVQLKIVLALSNLVIFLSRSSVLSIERWWTLIVLFNFGMWQLYISSTRSSDSFGKSAPAKKSVSQLTPTTKVTPNAIAGSSCIKVLSTEDSNVTESGTKLPTWLPITSREMEVRSRGYLTTKKKISSPGELYECIAVDCFQSDNRYSEMAMRVVLPKVEFKDQDTKRWKSPDLFVVSISIPTEAPSIGKRTDDGPGTTVVGYFKMKESTRTILRRITADGYDSSADNTESGVDAQKQITNGVKLWEEDPLIVQYCKTAPTDSNFQARFKLIPQLNIQELGCPSYISKYNGKPVLIKRNGVTGFLNDYPEISAMEFGICLHPFPYLFKQAMAYIKDNYFDKAVAKFGFVIEGRSDDELPEVVLGAMQVCYPSPKYVMSDKDFFGK
ncbi:hypothetical protein ACHAWO_003458 [Cyclotella atomus]|uniref:PH domain-containing protein n=1 Tax=Cyclotella atomus TaxID=382360 RepID=A0ABD3Q5V2_9STRA